MAAQKMEQAPILCSVPWALLWNKLEIFYKMYKITSGLLFKQQCLKMQTGRTGMAQEPHPALGKEGSPL